MLPCLMNIRRKKDHLRRMLKWERDRLHVHHLDRDKINTQYVEINFETVFEDAFGVLKNQSVQQLKRPLYIEVKNELGVADDGGLRRQFYIELCRAVQKQDNLLFSLAADGVHHYPNSKLIATPEHLKKLHFVGRMIGKALFDEDICELKLSKPLYKMMVCDYLDLEDMRRLDSDIAKSFDQMRAMKPGEIEHVGRDFSEEVHDAQG